MNYEFAPLEGLTTHVLRAAHRALFTPPARYFTPFLALTQNHAFGARERAEIERTHEDGVPVVPQVMTRCADDFLWAARELAACGFDEINLNMGCPSGTVVNKGKGAGLLRDTDALRALLDEIYGKTPLPVSLKTRLGLFDAQEFDEILDVLSDYPAPEIIVHPRVRTAYYGGLPDVRAFERALERRQIRLAYNGDLFTARDVRAFERRFPQVVCVMIGRGALANPAIFGESSGGVPLERARLRAYHDRICEEYIDLMGAGNALGRVKELWLYLTGAFENAKKQEKAIRKSRRMEELQDAVRALFDSAPLSPEAGYHRAGFESAWTQD